MCDVMCVFLEPTFSFYINAFRGEADPWFFKMLHRKKENNTVCSSINWPSNLVNNVIAMYFTF